MRQIHEKKYDLPFKTDDRQMICIGIVINFPTEIRNIGNYLIEIQ